MKKLMNLLVLMLGMISMCFGFSLIILATIIHNHGQTERRPNKADIIVVLAGPEYRMAYAAALWKQGIAPLVLCNGGEVNGYVIAERCRRDLIKNGVPADAIRLEPHSLSTEEHAIYLKPLLQENGWENLLIISSDYHLYRSRILFNQHGISAQYVAAPPANRGQFSYILSLVREAIATEWNAFKTFFGLPYTRVDIF